MRSVYQGVQWVRKTSNFWLFFRHLIISVRSKYIHTSTLYANILYEYVYNMYVLIWHTVIINVLSKYLHDEIHLHHTKHYMLHTK